MPRNLTIKTAPVFLPLLEPARYKGAWGGRGSGKSHFFAEHGGVDCALRWPGEYGEGFRWACVRETQKSLKDSAYQLIRDKIEKAGLTERDGFKVYNDRIALPGDGIITFDGMQDHTADSFKSKEGFHCAWVEEAHSLSQQSLTILRPTIRAPHSEIWFSWNPTRAADAVDQFMRGPNAPKDRIVVKANWRDNPWFPKVLAADRLDDLQNRPEQYGHIWEGEYATVLQGAYYARHLTEAEQQGRVGSFDYDDLLKLYAFWDIGGAGKKADATAIWIVQFSGDEIRFLDYYEAIGQPLDAHVRWLRMNKYDLAYCVLPHDGAKADRVHAVTYEGALREAGFETEVVPNQGRGAALSRVEQTRRLFHRFRFDRERTKAGREAVGWYHSRIDDRRGADLGPDHDWSSHGADAFGLVAVWKATQAEPTDWDKPIKRNIGGVL